MFKKKLNSYSNIILLGIISFLNDVSSEMITPILPFLISSIGGHGIAIGFIGGLKESFAEILKFISGYLSDKLENRKIFIWVGYLTTAIFKLCLIIANTWPLTALFIGLERIGKGIRTSPRDALITDSFPNNVGKGFGIHRTFDTCGAILGSIIVFFLMWKIHLSINRIIIIASAISYLSLIPLYWVKDTKQKKQDSFQPQQKNIPAKIFSAHLKTLISIATIFSFANISYMFFMLKAQKAFNGTTAFIAPLLFYILYNIFYSLTAVPCGILSDKIGRWKVITAGYFIFAITTGMMAFATQISSLVLCFILYGISIAIIKVIHKAYVSDLSQSQFKGTTLGSFDTITGFATLCAGIVGGILWEIVGPHGTFLYASSLSTISVALLISFRKKLTAPIVKVLPDQHFLDRE